MDPQTISLEPLPPKISQSKPLFFFNMDPDWRSAMPRHPPACPRHHPPGHAQKHANSMQIGFRARLDPCFARQGSFIPHLGPLRTAPGHFRARFSIEQARLHPTWGPQGLPLGAPRNPRNLELRAPSRKTRESGNELAMVTSNGPIATCYWFQVGRSTTLT